MLPWRSMSSSPAKTNTFTGRLTSAASDAQSPMTAAAMSVNSPNAGMNFSFGMAFSNSWSGRKFFRPVPPEKAL